ncbi:hypothetical protein D3C80_1537360 [compost metagenome]
MVARLLDVLLAAHHLPGLGPQLLRFQLVEGARTVALDRQILVAEAGVIRLQMLRNRHRFQLQQLLEQVGIAHLLRRQYGELGVLRIVHASALVIFIELVERMVTALREWSRR